MKIQQLLCFNEIAKTRSFSTAASNLFLSQPSVSYNIRELEKDLGVSLFERGFNNNDVELTESGKTFLDYSLKIIALCQQCEREFETLNYVNKKRIRIACNDQMTYGLIPALIKYAYNHYPTGETVFVDVSTSNSSYDTMQAIISGAVNFALYAEAPTDARLEFEPISTEKIVAYLPRSHPAAEKARICLSEINDLPIAVPNEEHSEMYNHIIKMFEYEGITPTFSEYSGVIAQSRICAVMQERCCSLGADFPINYRNVAKAEIDNPYSLRKVYAIWNKAFELTDVEKTLISFCKTYKAESGLT